MALTSTVPAALTTIQGYMQAVAAANPTLNAQVYLGPPAGTPTPNFMCVGSYDTAAQAPIDGYRLDWAAIPALAGFRSEEYSVACCLQAKSDDTNIAGRITDAFTMFDGILSAVQADIENPGNGALTPSGTWGAVTLTAPIVGPIGGAGWGVVLAFTIDVIGAQIVDQ